MVAGQQLTASLRAREAIPSPMRKLTPLAERAAAEGVHIYHLNIGQPDIPVPDAILQSIREWEGDLIPYAPSQGLPETVAAWQEYYATLGIELQRNEILVTSGGSEAIIFALMAIADPGDEVMVFEPSYANYFGFARMASVDVVPVTTLPEEGYHLPSDAEIEARIGPRTRAMLVTNPGNPTGTVYTLDEQARLLEIARRRGLFLVADETYREIVFDGPRDGSMLKLPGAAGHVVVVDSLSKRFGVTGARIGCLASHHQGVMTGAMTFAQARLSAPTVEQRAVIPLLRRPTAYTDPLTDTYRRRRDTVYRALSGIPGVRTHRPEGAFYVLAVLPVDDGDRFAAWLLSDFRHEGETVMISPGAGFYLTPGLGMHEIRLAFVLEEAALERAVFLLHEALRVYPGVEGIHAD